MKKHYRFLFIVLIFTVLPIIFNSMFLRTNFRSEYKNSQSRQLRRSDEPFFLAQEFGASTYYISPEVSPGSNDEVFFSFATNKNGNFSISINNFPNELTSTIELEGDVAFDNPSGTNLWYLSYVEKDLEFEGETVKKIGTYKVNLLTSDSQGAQWEKKTIVELVPAGINLNELKYDVVGMGLSAYPEIGLIGMVSWYHYSDLIFINSIDNGTTWNEPNTIVNAADIGAQLFFNPEMGLYPYLDICILKNSTINVITQADHPAYTPLVYFESHDNGNTWSLPKNITISHGDIMHKVKLQVDHTSGDYWLTWMYTYDKINFSIKWAEFHSWNNESLSSNVPTNIIYYGKKCNYDFLYDWKEPVFRMIQIHPIPFDNYEIFNFTCSNFGNSWENTSLGYHNDLEEIFNSYDTLNFGFDGVTIQLFYEASYTGFTEVYQYYVLENPIIWEINGFFMMDEPMQIFWNGRINDTIPITISTVEVNFVAQNDSNVITRTKYITIDNTYPYFENYIQGRYYFNPQSSNNEFSEINWDILASEECTAFLEIFKQGTSRSEWQKVTNNNLHEKDPQIFRSEWGDLYILYNTIELGTKILYLIKSYDNGITWGNPVEITRILSDSEDFRYAGAAWGPVVTIYVRDVGAGEDLLYRSFNGGEFFEPPIHLINLVGADKVEKLILTNNGSLFLLYRNSPALYTILESPDLGFTWSISTQWLDYPQNFTRILDMQADMVYDGEHDLLHVLLPYLNLTLVANYSVATLNVSSGIWREPRGRGTLFPMGLFSREPKLLITRAPDPQHIQIKIIYIHDQQPMGGWIHYTIKEIVSDDLGATWSGPSIVSDTNNATQFTSSTFDIFYTSQKSDGNDYEIYFSREGGLTRTKKETLSSGIDTQISFDGLDDFGAYISEGNYSYNLHIRDDAGNFIDTHGWFYADYTNPTITEPEHNWDFEPTPRLDVEIRADIGDNTSVSAVLYYKKDLGPWIPVPMENIGGYKYLAIIPHDNITSTVQYYIEAMDLAGNTIRRDAGGSYYTYDLPDYNWIHTGLFNETTTYSSSQNYEISVSITTDFEYVLNIVFRYSTDGGSTWDELELLPNSPVFTGYLENIPQDTRTLMYQVVLNDIFGQQVVLMDTQQISFFPEIPSLSITGSQSIIIIIIAAVVGFLVAYGYIQLKGKSHEVIYRQIFLREYTKRSLTAEGTSAEQKTRKKRGKKREIKDQNGILSEKYVGTSPFTIAFLGILSATLIIFIVGYFYSEFNPQGGILLLAASLVLSIFGYMILISRDISLNIYLEKIFKRNIILEFFQIIFMLLIIIMILFKGFAIPWFRYYLIEQTYEIGTISIPKLYISVFGVFFTSLVLVMITTYLQLKKTVKNVRKQRSQGATDNLLLFVKDQNSSRLITQMGYKTIAFLVTVLIGIVTTTNLLTVETGIALLVVVIPFIIAGFSGLIVHRLLERKKQKKEAEEIELPFIDSKKVCNKCGESIYLTNKYCGSCGSQVIYTDNVGIYTSKCTKCNGYIYDKAEFCPTCGNEVTKQE